MSTPVDEDDPKKLEAWAAAQAHISIDEIEASIAEWSKPFADEETELARIAFIAKLEYLLDYRRRNAS